MKMRSRYVFGAALAAASVGMIPGIDAAPVAEGAIIADFSFEGIASNPGAVSSFSYAAESGSATVTLAKSATGGSISAVAGNGSTKSLTGNNLIGSSYTFKFAADDVNSIALSFDTTGSATGPRDFVVSYSNDGVNFSSLSTFAIGSTGQSGFSTGSSSTDVGHAFVLPTSFGDLNPGVAGDFGYLQIAVADAVAINGGAVGTGGTNRIDNVIISGSPIAVVPEAGTTSVLTLAASALLARRNKKNA